MGMGMGNENKLKKEKKMTKGGKGSPKIGKKNGLVNQFKKNLSWNLKCARVFISWNAAGKEFQSMIARGKKLFNVDVFEIRGTG